MEEKYYYCSKYIRFPIKNVVQKIYDLFSTTNKTSISFLDKLPDSEMSEIKLFEKLPKNLTYPNVSPSLYEEAYKVYLLLKI